MSGAPAPTRRGLLTGAGAALGGAGAALLAAGCGSSSKPASGPAVTRAPAAGAAHADVQILGRALELERRTVAAYTASIPLLDHARAHWAKRLLAEELAHTGELISLIKLAGATAGPPADSYAIGDPRDPAGALAVLESLESRQIAGYLSWIPRLSPGSTRAAAASILAADAQHITALRQARGRPALTSAFLAGPA